MTHDCALTFASIISIVSGGAVVVLEQLALVVGRELASNVEQNKPAKRAS